MAQAADEVPAHLSEPQLQLLKQLNIHSGALKRYAKELNSYLDELKGLRDDLEKMRSEAESDDQKENRAKQIEIRQQHEQIQETTNVIQDIRPKLVSTWENVDELMNQLTAAVPAMDDDNKQHEQIQE